MSDVKRILSQIESGEPHAAEQLLPLVYDALRKLAARKLAREAPGQSIDATALVHEAYLRLVGGDHDRSWAGRTHFFAAAAEAMRRILIDQARRKRSIKRGGALRRQALDDVELGLPERAEELLALDEALAKFAEKDAAKAELVKLRYFAGLTLPQAAEVLGISPTTADRYWAYARAWLHTEMANEE